MAEALRTRPPRPAAPDRRWQSVPLAGGIAMFGLTAAAANTTLSLFLADAVHAAPFLIGLFFAARAASGIGIGLSAGRISDRMRDRRVILSVTAACGAIGTLCLALSRDYLLVLAASVTFASVGRASFGQLFAYANEFATARGRDVTGFTSVMRSVFSAAYVFGPPLGLSIMARYGFRSLYLGAAVVWLALAVTGRWGLRRAAPRELPSVPRAAPVPRAPRGRPGAGAPRRAPRAGSALPARTWLLLGVVLALGTVNQVYGIDISLHVTRGLGLSPQLVGWMLGLAAALEIPVMIIAGRVARRAGRGRIVGVSAILATVFFCLLPLATSPAALLALAVLQGVWQGVALSIPMVMVQDEAPGGAGTSTALYNAAFGTSAMVAGTITGVTASAIGYGNVFWVCAALSAAAVLLMLARLARARRTR